MKIAILTNEFPPEIYGGAGVHIGKLVEEYCLLNNREMFFDVFHFGKNNTERKNILRVNPTFVSTEKCNNKSKLFSESVSNQLKDVDIVHCHTWHTLLAGVTIKKHRNIPLIITAHSLDKQRPWKREQLGKRYEFVLKIESLAYSLADKIIAVSDFMAEYLLKNFFVTENQIEVIKNGVDLFKPNFNLNLLSSVNIDASKPFILFVGRISKQKGLYYLLKAFESIKNAELQLVICGGKPDTHSHYDKLRVAAANIIKKGKKIVWIDNLQCRKTLSALYTSAEFSICPSLYEPFGLTVVESMSCGTPVIGTNIDGIKENILDNNNGILISPGKISSETGEPEKPNLFIKRLADAIRFVSENPEIKDTLSLNAKRRLTQLPKWNEVAQKHIELYEKTYLNHKAYI